LLPSEVLDLSGWYLNLPVNDAQMIKQPALLSYESSEYFFAHNGSVVFTAPCGGATTKHSNYPRCELRETERHSTKLASWSTDSGVHVLTLSGAALVLPPVKPQVVLAQIHDASGDLLEVVADGLAVKGKVVVTIRWQGIRSSTHLDDDYALGSPYTLNVRAAGGVMKVEYSGAGTSRSLSSSLERDGCYFKAGCYTQSNPSKGDDPAAIGRTQVTALAVTHLP
jgi:hypothetical protein